MERKATRQSGEFRNPVVSNEKKRAEVKISNELAREIAEMEKHELLCAMASCIGNDPSCLGMAEQLFEKVKYSLTEYVLKHEYNNYHDLEIDVTLWLEHQTK